MRLIDADELKKKVSFQKDDFPCEKEDEFWNWAVDSIIEIIGNAPTVDIPNYGGQVVPDILQGWRYEEKTARRAN